MAGDELLDPPPDWCPYGMPVDDVEGWRWVVLMGGSPPPLPAPLPKTGGPRRLSLLPFRLISSSMFPDTGLALSTPSCALCSGPGDILGELGPAAGPAQPLRSPPFEGRGEPVREDVWRCLRGGESTGEDEP